MARRDRIVRSMRRFRLVVTLKDGSTWDGVLFDSDERTLLLYDATAIQSDRSRVSADGDVLLHREDVSYIQHVPEMQR